MTGSLSTVAEAEFTLDFYASATCDSSGYGEGTIYLGSTTVTTDTNGDATFSAAGLAGVEDDSTLEITATATDADGNTSEFSACVTAEFVLGYDGEADWHYEYDGLYRVTYACDAWDEATTTCTGSEWTYEYDGAGNLTRYDRWDANSASVSTVAYLYNGANQITCVDADLSGACDNGEITYQYDAYGNLLSDGVSTYTYDGAMRLTSVTDGTSTTTYSYTGDGDRIAQTVDGVTTTYVLDTASSLTMVLAESTTGEDPIYYLHGLGLVAQSDGTDTEYFERDGLGIVRQLTDESGQVLYTQTFDPYGNVYLSAGSTASTFGYAGEQTDSNGLIFLRARYYAPGMGRFLNTDPSRQEVNPYGYSRGNPIIYTDPSGEICIATEAGYFDIPPYKIAPCKHVADDLITWHDASTQFQNIQNDPALSSQMVLYGYQYATDQTAGATYRYFDAFVCRQHRIMNYDQYYDYPGGGDAYVSDIWRQTGQLWEVYGLVVGGAVDIAALRTSATLQAQVLNQIDDDLYGYADNIASWVVRAEIRDGGGGGSIGNSGRLATYSNIDGDIQMPMQGFGASSSGSRLDDIPMYGYDWTGRRTDQTLGVLDVSGYDSVYLRSGQNGPAQQIPSGTSGFDAYTRTHVEGHAAAIMRIEGISEATLYINQAPCSSCDRLLTRMLPSGSVLDIRYPDQVVRYIGR